MSCFLLDAVSGWTRAQISFQAVAAVGAITTLFYSLRNFTRALREISNIESGHGNERY
ncbi:MAG TPA: hypothetical protein VI636_18000 [Candidatus Angelobacter sp.]